MNSKTFSSMTDQELVTFIGRRVRFDYGAGCGEDFATIVGFERGAWHTELTAITDDGNREGISGFTDIGVGTYLLNDQVSA